MLVRVLETLREHRRPGGDLMTLRLHELSVGRLCSMALLLEETVDSVSITEDMDARGRCIEPDVQKSDLRSLRTKE